MSSRATAGEPEVPVPPTPHRWFLDNGLSILFLPVRQSRLVATVMAYRVGAADEEDEIAGIAHFLEHMMFKGSRGFGLGEIDRRTQILGGWNNAFTSHDSTAYVFGFASDRWEDALEMEADRMQGLLLDAQQVESERRVVKEEISMYMDDPWDCLELEVHRAFFGRHPYARPILGTRESLAQIEVADLRSFHDVHYRPQNAVLAIAGDASFDAVESAVERCFSRVPPRQGTPPPGVAPCEGLTGLRRVERRKGETSRFLLALPAPPATDPEHAGLVLATTILGSGRTSRLYRRLVEDLRLCSRISADVTETRQPGVTTVMAEAMPGASPAAIESEIFAVLHDLASASPSCEETARARSMLIADWVFGHERVHQQAMLAAMAETVFSADYPARHLQAIADCLPADITRCATAYLSPVRGSVVGWSLPASDSRA